jgi:hypothetical protein
VLPSDTLPKFTAEGLALSALEGTELGAAGVGFAAAAVETPFALVTPVQPERIPPHINSVSAKKRTKDERPPCPSATAKTDREREFPECVSITRRVYGTHTVQLYWSGASIRYRRCGVSERTFGAGLWGRDRFLTRLMNEGNY